MHRRQSLVMLAGLAGMGLHPAWAQGATPIEVWKDAECGCCEDWVRHLQASGFRAVLHNSGNTAARARAGIPAQLGSCHTAMVGGYAIEGHVPASDIRRLLKERPAAIGLAVQGMPVGSPGMDAPVYRGRKDPFDVLLVLRDGRSMTWRSYNRS